MENEYQQYSASSKYLIDQVIEQNRLKKHKKALKFISIFVIVVILIFYLS